MISQHAGQWLFQAIETKSAQLLEANPDPSNPALAVLRAYASSSLPARFAFVEQLIAAIDQSPRLKISVRKL